MSFAVDHCLLLFFFLVHFMGSGPQLLAALNNPYGQISRRCLWSACETPAVCGSVAKSNGDGDQLIAEYPADNSTFTYIYWKQL